MVYNRRSFFVIFLVMLLGFTFITCLVVDKVEAAEYTLIFAGLQPPSHPEYPLTVEFINRVKELSNGRIEFEYYDSGVLGDEGEMIELTQTGSIDMCRNATSILGSIADAFRVFTLPFLYTDRNAIIEIARSDKFSNLLGDKLESEGIHLIDFTWSGVRDLYTRTPVTTIEDVKGLKLRTWQDKYVVKSWEMLGAIPTPISFSEVYTSLQTGVVDGAEGYAGSYISSSFYEQAPYLTKLGYLNNLHAILINKNTWEKLPSDLQLIIEQASSEISIRFGEQFESEADNIYKQAVENGAEVLELKDIEKWRTTLEPIYEEFVAEYGKEYADFINWVLTEY